MTELKNRIDFVYLFDVQDGNPNGDPDAGNMPRIDAETGMGLVTDVCLKRKVRNYIQVAKGCSDGYDIFIKEKAVLDTIVNSIYDYQAVKNEKDAEKKKKIAKALMCKYYYDIRTFGAVIATTGKPDQVRGPIQLTFARSVNVITSSEHTITRMAVTKEADKDDERTMGRKSTVPYGLYLCHGFISANLAKQTGFSEEDLELFWEALKNMFDNDRSAARGLMSAQKLIIFQHGSPLGNAPANKLFDLVRVEKNNKNEVARSFTDYQVIVDKEKAEKEYNVTIKELL
ncbi:MAG: type I-C CRISPR-associated protein Cas7/Csd2 [Mediterranea sp.]|jgi:CRISPR-associated protein Csd2|nr:type I-C CRISPR-associated protein Cas7/Csd2 [Mediterranea sp.]